MTGLQPNLGGPSVLPSHLHRNITTALLDTRVVGVVRPRQAGKSTLVRQIVAERPDAGYASLDDADVRAQAITDPQGFVEGRPGLFVIDEIQRAPELLLAIKASVDRQPSPGRFLITGSSQLSANRTVSETLAGRIEREAPGISASPRTADLPRTSVQRYLDTLEALFLIVRIPAWAANLSQREIRAPKVYLTDPGLAGYLRRAEVDPLLRPEIARGADGPIVEGFVLAELLRQAGSLPDPPELAHYRDRDTVEIDIIIESPDGRVAAVEVKAGPGAAPGAVRNLVSLRDLLGDRFAAGVVLHSGQQATQLSDRILSLPISALWA